MALEEFDPQVKQILVSQAAVMRKRGMSHDETVSFLVKSGTRHNEADEVTLIAALTQGLAKVKQKGE